MSPVGEGGGEGVCGKSKGKKKARKKKGPALPLSMVSRVGEELVVRSLFGIDRIYNTNTMESTAAGASSSKGSTLEGKDEEQQESSMRSGEEESAAVEAGAESGRESVQGELSTRSYDSILSQKQPEHWMGDFSPIDLLARGEEGGGGGGMELSPDPSSSYSSLPDTKIKRNYNCTFCIDFFTQNPRAYLYHLKEQHGKTFKVYECPSCIYASQHSQKLERHIRICHQEGSSSVQAAPKTNSQLMNKQGAKVHPPRARKSQSSTALNSYSLSSLNKLIANASESYNTDYMGYEMDLDENGGLGEDGGNGGEMEFDPGSIPFSHFLSTDDGGEFDEEDPGGEDEQALNNIPHSLPQGGGGGVKKGSGKARGESSKGKKKNFNCTLCNYVTNIKARFTKHVKYHSMPLIKCDFCDFKTPYKWNLDRHLKNHNGLGPLQCPLCNFSAEIKQSLTVHIQNHHANESNSNNFELGEEEEAEDGCGEGEEEEDEEEEEDSRLEQQLLMRKALAAATKGSGSGRNASNSNSKPHPSKFGSNSKSQGLNTTHYDYRPNQGPSESLDPGDIVERNGLVFIKKIKCKYCPFKAVYEAEMHSHVSSTHGVSKKPSGSPPTPPTSAPKPMPSLIPIQHRSSTSPPINSNNNSSGDERGENGEGDGGISSVTLDLNEELDQGLDCAMDIKNSYYIKKRGSVNAVTVKGEDGDYPTEASKSMFLQNFGLKTKPSMSNDMVITPVQPGDTLSSNEDEEKDGNEMEVDITLTSGSATNNKRPANPSNNGVGPQKFKMPKLTRAPGKSGDSSPSDSIKSGDISAASKARPTPPPILKPLGAGGPKATIDKKSGVSIKHFNGGGGALNEKVGSGESNEAGGNDSNKPGQKKVLWKCKKCDFKHSSKELVVFHIREYHKPKKGESVSILKRNNMTSEPASYEDDEERGRGQDGEEEDEELSKSNAKGHQFVFTEGEGYSCNFCPFTTEDSSFMEDHSENHFSKPNCNFSCQHCSFSVSTKQELIEHLQLHGIIVNESDGEAPHEKEKGRRKRDLDPTLTISQEETPPKPRNYTSLNNSPFKKYHCIECPYVTDSKGQFLYHKQFHRPRNAPFKCAQCSYNVSHKHLLHQHLRVHGMSASQMTFEEQEAMIETRHTTPKLRRITPKKSPTLQQFRSSQGQEDDEEQGGEDIPSSYVSKIVWQAGKPYRIYQCRCCPLVFNQLQDLADHEENEHGIITPQKTSLLPRRKSMSPTKSYLYLCDVCPARYSMEKEYLIHKTFHWKEYPYKCSLCSYSARQNHPHLMSHMKVHTEEYQRKTEILLESISPHPKANGIDNTLVGEELPPPPQPPRRASLPAASTSTTSNHSSEKLRRELLKGKSNQSQAPSKELNCSQCEFCTDNETMLLIHEQKHNDPNSAEQYQLLGMKSGEIMKMVLPPFDPTREAEAFVGNPEFIYPTLLKNGRVRPKRYKCRKCPSAFEKRDQYYVHLGLHGSNQRYKCTACNYSVRFWANFLQHVKKHAMQKNPPADLLDIQPISKPKKGYVNLDGVLTAIPDGSEEGMHFLETPHSSNTTRKSVPSSTAVKESSYQPIYDHNSIWKCNRCPFRGADKKSLEIHSNHHKLPVRSARTFTCSFCDFSINQAEAMKLHTLQHFDSAEAVEMSCDAFMMLDDVEIYINGGEGGEDEKLFCEKENLYQMEEEGKELERLRASGELKVTLVDVRINSNEDEEP